MNNSPQRIKVLFIANASSTHTHSWIDLLHDATFDVRLFAVENSAPPAGYPVTSYSLKAAFPEVPYSEETNESWMARVIEEEQPDIIHTLGIFPAALSYLSVHNRLPPSGKRPRWIVTARGGSDFYLTRLVAEEAAKIGRVLRACDQFIADNVISYGYALDLGLAREKVSPVGPVPGTGGMDWRELLALANGAPSQRQRVILWPKVYDCPYSKALPVFEALRICWDQIKPCRIFMTAMTEETLMWFQALPEEIKASSCCLGDRMPRQELLQLMGMSRVMLAPSLIDGVPNSLYEAMGTRTFPIVSPIETIRSVIDESNALFARNLYPEEIAAALTKAMNDDPLVDRITAGNLEVVKRLVDRDAIRQKVTANYLSLAVQH